MVPWLALPPCTLLGKAMTDYLMGREWSLTKVRKVVQSCCFLGQNIALFCMCHTTNFTAALICMTIVIGKRLICAIRCLQIYWTHHIFITGGTGFHNNAVIVNPQDLAPAYSGSVFGLMNTVGAIPGNQILLDGMPVRSRLKCVFWFYRIFGCIFSWSYFGIDTKLACRF